jgi:hypothetical protein
MHFPGRKEWEIGEGRWGGAGTQKKKQGWALFDWCAMISMAHTRNKEKNQHSAADS